MAHVQNLLVCLRNLGSTDCVKGIQKETFVYKIFQNYQSILILQTKMKRVELTNMNKLSKLPAVMFQRRQYRGTAKEQLYETFTFS